MRTLLSQAGISDRDDNYIPQFTVGCSGLSLSKIPASGTKIFISNLIHDVLPQNIRTKFADEDVYFSQHLAIPWFIAP